MAARERRFWVVWMFVWRAAWSGAVDAGREGWVVDGEWRTEVRSSGEERRVSRSDLLEAEQVSESEGSRLERLMEPFVGLEMLNRSRRRRRDALLVFENIGKPLFFYPGWRGLWWEGLSIMNLIR